MNSPTPLDLAALVGPAAWSRLPAALQRRFAANHAPVTYRGRLDLRCSALGHVLAWLVKPFRSPLVAANATGVPTTVSVRPVGTGVLWERSFEGGIGQVCSTKALDSTGKLCERTHGGLGMTLRVYERGGALVFESQRYFLALGRFHLVIPRLLSPGTCCVEHDDLGGGQFRFTLSMRHPLWGETFHQSGVFQDPAPHDRPRSPAD